MKNFAQKEKAFILGLSCGILCNFFGWSLFFAAGTADGGLRVGWQRGLLTNVLGFIVLIIAFYIHTFTNTED